MISKGTLEMRCSRTILAGLVFIVGSLSVDAMSARPPIRPRPHFIGRVNRRHRVSVVATVCPGPTSPGQQGPVAAGQFFSVSRVSQGHGDTGVFSQIYAWFEPDPGSATAPVAATITTYGTRVPI